MEYNVKGLRGTKKTCDECGKEINMKRIRVTWYQEVHCFKWICGECYQKLVKEEKAKSS